MSTKARQTFCHTLRGESINQGRLNHILTSEAHVTHLGGQSIAKAATPPLRPRPAVPLRSSILRRLWPVSINSRNGQVKPFFSEISSAITKHLKKANESALRVLVSCRSGSA
jgi:hypothetical protein